MKKLLSTVFVLVLVLALASATLVAQAAPQTIANGTQFRDTANNVVHAHGGGVLKVGSYYYWFGENRNANNTFRYVSAYRSTDLKNWEFRANVLTQSSHAELASANIERPKVIYNASTGKYVMWMHKELASDYSQARAAVASSSNVEGPYTYHGSFRPLNHMSRDITAFVDGTTGYMISAANENYDLHIYRLSADYLTVSTLVGNFWPGGHREAPAIFKRGSVYFLLTSGATGWNPNQAKYATATNIAGPWTGWTNVGDGTTFGSQSTYVLPVQGTSTTSYLYMGDRWAGAWGGPVQDSQYVWLPISFPSSTSMSMSWFPQITIDAATGAISGVSATYYRLTNRNSGKVADVPGQVTTDGTRIKQYPWNGGNNQQWEFQDAGGGYFRIVGRQSGKCLDVVSASTADGAQIEIWTCNGGTNQQFQWIATGSYFNIKARHSGKCIGIVGASTADGALLEQRTCGTGNTFQWSRQ